MRHVYVLIRVMGQTPTRIFSPVSEEGVGLKIENLSVSDRRIGDAMQPLSCDPDILRNGICDTRI